ncbi:hypothetical protein [Quadrisphaera granulorum]|uniref:hypothetical protein n=1 Tax=Quadrisphaera granulorum TaxID=317664 RepID=UPI0011B76FB6|nr:hypothetical protein [Quadrisphaera granulorum]
MIATPRPSSGPLPGDLYLDPEVPACERVTISRNGWSAQASHIWTGTGWTRLSPGVVHDVPAHPDVTLPVTRTVPVSAPREVSAEALDRWRRRRAALEEAQRQAVAEAETASAAAQGVADAS